MSKIIAIISLFFMSVSAFAGDLTATKLTQFNEVDGETISVASNVTVREKIVALTDEAGNEAYVCKATVDAVAHFEKEEVALKLVCAKITRKSI